MGGHLAVHPPRGCGRPEVERRRAAATVRKANRSWRPSGSESCCQNPCAAEHPERSWVFWCIRSTSGAHGSCPWSVVRGPGTRGRFPSLPPPPGRAWAVRCPCTSLWCARGGAVRRLIRCPRARLPMATEAAACRPVMRVLPVSGACQCWAPRTPVQAGSTAITPMAAFAHTQRPSPLCVVHRAAAPEADRPRASDRAITVTPRSETRAPPEPAVPAANPYRPAGMPRYGHERSRHGQRDDCRSM